MNATLRFFNHKGNATVGVELFDGADAYANVYATVTGADADGYTFEGAALDERDSTEGAYMSAEDAEALVADALAYLTRTEARELDAVLADCAD